ncbi:uncharacterized protein LOC128832422 [Malaclemys terrapin pileata]|uniref:uncharacterized protein LOC128832422 n=1 Tax=Malaclemys terrapin pileata TaxID=2991368 RepID=UPI0023A87161|nr:uncharacterized protein LOC128832422 [Malaclemys terrapin pileata]
MAVNLELGNPLIPSLMIPTEFDDCWTRWIASKGGPYEFKKESGETWTGLCRAMVETEALRNSNKSKKARILQLMSLAVRQLRQHAGMLAKQVTEKTGEVEEVTQAVEHWKAQALLAEQQAVQIHDMLEQVKQENKKLETTVENLQKQKVPSPVINIGHKQQASGSYPVPEEWGQKWKNVVLVKLKDERGSTALQPPPYDKSQVPVKPKLRPRLVPVRTGQVSAQKERVAHNTFSELVNQMKENIEQFTEHIRRQELRLDRRGVNKKAFQSKKTKLNGLTPRIDAITHGAAQNQLTAPKKGTPAIHLACTQKQQTLGEQIQVLQDQVTTPILLSKPG